VVNVDLTSDKAASVGSWRVGTSGYTIAVGATAAQSNLTVYGLSTLASNDVVLLETAAGSVTNLTVWSNNVSTNYTITLSSVLKTNLAVGDVIRRRHAIGFTLQVPSATNTTNFIVSSTNGLAANDLIVSDRASSISTSAVYSVSTSTNNLLQLAGPAVSSLAIDDQLYEQSTNYALILATSLGATETNMHVATTNNFVANDLVLVESASGAMAVKTVFAVNTTNISLTSSNQFTLAANDRIWRLTTNVYAVNIPSDAGARYVGLSNVAGITTNDILIANPSSGAWRQTATGTVIGSNILTVTTVAALPLALEAGTAFYKLTNSYVLVTAMASNTDVANVSTATNLTLGDALYLSPAAGGVYRKHFQTTNTLVTSVVTFSTPSALASASGDNLFLAGPAVTTPVGATTVRLQGSALFTAPPGRPAFLTLDGTSTNTINQVNVNYAR